MLLQLFVSCEKDSVSMLIGAWDDLDSELIICFHEGGIYSWHLPFPGVDPNTGIGHYEVYNDTLRIEEASQLDSCIIYYYDFRITREELTLINLDSQSIKNYVRIDKYFNK